MFAEDVDRAPVNPKSNFLATRCPMKILRTLVQPVARVELLGIGALEPFHPGYEVRLRRFQKPLVDIRLSS